MAREPRPGETAVPGPVVLRVRRGVHADPAAARPHVALERVLLGRVEHVAGGAQEDDRAVAAQVALAERGRVLRRVDREAVRLAELLQRGDARLDGAVPEGGRLREDQHARRLRLAHGEAARSREQEHGKHQRSQASGQREHDRVFGKVKVRVASTARSLSEAGAMRRVLRARAAARSSRVGWCLHAPARPAPATASPTAPPRGGRPHPHPVRSARARSCRR